MTSQTTTEMTIATIARKCARELLAQGWAADANAYDLLPGDAEALRDALGRKTTREERIELERAIRLELAQPRHLVACRGTGDARIAIYVMEAGVEIETNAGPAPVGVGGSEGAGLGVSLHAAAEALSLSPAELRARVIAAVPEAADWDWHSDALADDESEAYRVGRERLPSAEEVDEEVRYYAEEARRWYCVSREDVIDLGQRILRGDVEAYSRWCAETAATEIVRLSDGTTARREGGGGWSADGEPLPRDWTPARASEWVTLETMPDHLRESHRAAENWGRYPFNGAARELVLESDALDVVAGDVDGYARIVGRGPVPLEA